MILYYREYVTFKLLDLALFIAPKKLEIILAKGIYQHLEKYQQMIKDEYK